MRSFNIVDEAPKICVHKGCFNRCRVGLPGRCATYCKQHIQPGMMIDPNRKCLTCRKQAIYGVGVPIRCKKHKEPYDLNYIERRCVSCNQTMILNKESKCQYCAPDIYNKTRLAKKNRVKYWLDTNTITYVNYDHRIKNRDCLDYHPDFIFDCGTHIVVLEIDENQYKEREVCECRQMITIFNRFEMPIKFVRYNPDPYFIMNRKKHPPFGTRMGLLKYHLQYAFDDPPVANLSVKHLYFNNQKATCFVPVVEVRDYGL
jgi:hypothetical protein